MDSKQISSHQFPDVYKALDIDLAKLGCVMLDLKPFSNMYSIEWEGAGVALYYSSDPKKFWIDGWVASEKLHVTLLYGLLEEGKNYENYIESVLHGWKLEQVEIEDIGYFNSPYPNEPYWCIVAHIKKTPELIEGRQRLELLPHINTFTGYKPHSTICYINKNQGEAYRDGMIEEFRKLWMGKELEVKSLNLGSNKK